MQFYAKKSRPTQRTTLKFRVNGSDIEHRVSLKKPELNDAKSLQCAPVESENKKPDRTTFYVSYLLILMAWVVWREANLEHFPFTNRVKSSVSQSVMLDHSRWTVRHHGLIFKLQNIRIRRNWREMMKVVEMTVFVFLSWCWKQSQCQVLHKRRIHKQLQFIIIHTSNETYLFIRLCSAVVVHGPCCLAAGGLVHQPRHVFLSSAMLRQYQHTWYNCWGNKLIDPDRYLYTKRAC